MGGFLPSLRSLGVCFVMRTFLRSACWSQLVGGWLGVLLLLLSDRAVAHALWWLPIFLTLAICGFSGLLIVYLLPEVVKVYAAGRQDERRLVHESIAPERPRLTAVPRT